MDGLVDASKEPFVYRYEYPVPFLGWPADIVHHLTRACGDHYWPLAKNIKARCATRSPCRSRWRINAAC